MSGNLWDAMNVTAASTLNEALAVFLSFADLHPCYKTSRDPTTEECHLTLDNAPDTVKKLCFKRKLGKIYRGELVYPLSEWLVFFLKAKNNNITIQSFRNMHLKSDIIAFTYETEKHILLAN